MIIATAGHVDHGKTTLVKALTGVDTDRLKEEKERGMSIDLGFAYIDVGNGLGNGQSIGFVDVPGHERFLRNMLAGVAAIDFALLVVAADDGPMPQTVEHVAILDLLGVKRAAVALTKTDRVSADRVLQAREEINALLASCSMQGAPVFPLATTSGEGVGALRDYLQAVALGLAGHPCSGNFRLAIDRSFILPGAGLVLAGAVVAGTARVGDQLIVSPQGIPVRVRGIHAQNRPADAARTGQRCALNIAGSDLRHGELGRGDWLVAPMLHAPTDRLDVRIRLLASEKRALAHWTPVHMHIGAGVVNARVAILADRAIGAGEHGLAQLVVDTPIAALYGDRFVLRDQSAQRTIAGGVVLDPFGPAKSRSKPARLARLAAWNEPCAEDALKRLLDAQPDGVELERFALARNVERDEWRALCASLAVRAVTDGDTTLGFSTKAWQTMQDQLGAAVEEWHRQHPESLGPSGAELAEAVHARPRSPLLRGALAALVEEGGLQRSGLRFCLPGHAARLSEGDASLLEKVTAILETTGLRPPIVGELSRMLDMEQPPLMEFLERAAMLGHLVRVAKNRFFLPGTVDALAEAARQLAEAAAHRAGSEAGRKPGNNAVPGSFDAASYRDCTGIGRNLTVEVLEFLDRMHVTRFVAGRRVMV